MTRQLINCDRCLMNSTAPNFVKHSDGSCNFCSDFIKRFDNLRRHEKSNLASQPNNLFEWIRSQRKPDTVYDCVIGVSGGVDSSWVLHLAVQYGLRPLAVHLDNTWNSGLATHNVRSLIDSLRVDLQTYVLDYSSFDAALKCFIYSGVLDLELLTDHLLISINYLYARRYNIKYILSGDNLVTEGVHMPQGWNWFKYDFPNINSILRAGGFSGSQNLPLLNYWSLFNYKVLQRITWMSPLNTVPYSKSEAIQYLVEFYNYIPYPYKHYESLLTRFYQGYILPKKGFVDKRRVHLSTLVLTNQMSRSQALDLLSQSPYPDPVEEYTDLHFFLDKLHISIKEFDSYLSTPFISHENFSSILPLWRVLRFFRLFILSIRNLF